MKDVFFLQKDNIYAVPITHYTMEMAGVVHETIRAVNPDCIAVELAETMQLQLLHAASRLPDISVVISYDTFGTPIYYLSEPCDAGFEALRCALERNIAAYCIDLDVDHYPQVSDPLPDPYAVKRIGLKEYYTAFAKSQEQQPIKKDILDENREIFMAKRLKELSLSYDKILYVGGMTHIQAVLDKVDQKTFPQLQHAQRGAIEICTLTEESCRDVLGEFGWISEFYEEARALHVQDPTVEFPPDRQKLIYQLFRESGYSYEENENLEFPGYHMRNLMKFTRNYSLISNRLMPDLFQILTAAKACVEHNYAYEVWQLATYYSYLQNVDNLPELDLSIEQIWGQSKYIRFQLRQPGRKGYDFHLRDRKKNQYRFEPPGPFTICSYPPEDIAVENFGEFLQKKGTQLYSEEGAQTTPFSTSLEDGIDTKETIRHWSERKLYVKIRGKPPAGVGSVCVIFDEDAHDEEQPVEEKYPWRTTWLGEHDQESDMAFYSTPMGKQVVGPGITRCVYGGFLMSYPPRRMYDVWSDTDYSMCRNKPEVLLMAAIDYAVKPIVVYVAAKPPPKRLKVFAGRFGKKIIYIPIGQLSPVILKKIRNFHVLDGRDRRDIADDYIH